mmetsp:Transcript_12694/g.41857  ORF Transcript_12694/g.41857 Transcript_12694/m.41857 type:complete len:207 (-) Transcript_12694:626-1246(-)
MLSDRRAERVVGNLEDGAAPHAHHSPAAPERLLPALLLDSGQAQLVRAFNPFVHCAQRVLHGDGALRPDGRLGGDAVHRERRLHRHLYVGGGPQARRPRLPTLFQERLEPLRLCHCGGCGFRPRGAKLYLGVVRAPRPPLSRHAHVPARQGSQRHQSSFRDAHRLFARVLERRRSPRAALFHLRVHRGDALFGCGARREPERACKL